MNMIGSRLLPLVLSAALLGCAVTLPAMPSRAVSGETLAVGRVITVLTGPTNRWFAPELRFFEVVNRASGERVRVNVQSSDSWFVLPLPAGEYELSRIQISEGAFIGLAGLEPTFRIGAGETTYIGTWRLGIESPQYDRSVLLSAVLEPEQAVRDGIGSVISLGARPLSVSLLSPSTVETRLYEAPPYPRFWWFKRHHTS